jgi:hypothetical protein
LAACFKNKNKQNKNAEKHENRKLVRDVFKNSSHFDVCGATKRAFF